MTKYLNRYFKNKKSVPTCCRNALPLPELGFFLWLIYYLPVQICTGGKLSVLK